MMGRGNMGKQIANAPASKKFKPCSECPSPAKCKAAGKCMLKSKK